MLKTLISWWTRERLHDLALLLPMLCLLVAIFLPPIFLSRPVHHYQITFDISQSMNVQDISLNGKASSRLDLARASAQKLLTGLPCGSRVGWSVFTGARTLPLIKPLEVCEHYSGLRSSLDLIDGKMRWFNGSSVGKGLHQSLRGASAIGDDAAVVMITDGHEAPPLRPGQKGLPKSEELGIKGFLAGVGGDNPVPIPKTDLEGRDVGNWLPHEVAQRPGVDKSQSNEELSERRSEHLTQLAHLSGLEYLPIDKPDDLVTAVKNSTLSKRAPAPVDLRWIPATLALLFLCWRFFPSLIRSRRNTTIANT